MEKKDALILARSLLFKKVKMWEDEDPEHFWYVFPVSIHTTPAGLVYVKALDLHGSVYDAYEWSYYIDELKCEVVQS